MIVLMPNPSSRPALRAREFATLMHELGYRAFIELMWENNEWGRREVGRS